MKLEERKKRVLEAIILDYIATAEPVGSRTISKKYDLGVSPATVRNEMSDLEEMGLLEQPHTSAGRIPSQIGYRYYVDFLMERQSISEEVKRYIRNALRSKIKAAEDMVQSATKLLAQMTNYTTFLMASTYKDNVLTHIQLLPLSEHKLVLILVLDNGHVEHRVIDMPVPLTERQLDEISSVLRQNLCGLTVDQWRKQPQQVLRARWDGEISLLEDLLNSVEEALTVEYEHKLYLSGTINILNQPEFVRDVDKVREILGLLEEERVMHELMQKYISDEDQEIKIRIGREIPHEVLSSCSLITATYHLDGKVIGTVGVLGPTRMDYSKTASLLEYITKSLANELNKG